MPQTKFVLKKSLELGLKPIVIINKIDKPAARPNDVIDMVFDLFVALGATDEQLDFPHLFAIARDGIAQKELTDDSSNLDPLFEMIMDKVPEADQNFDAPFRMQPSSLAYDKYVGRMAIGRVYEGTVATGQTVYIKKPDGSTRQGKISKILEHRGLQQIESEKAVAGDIVIIAGIPDIFVGETITTDQDAEPLAAITIDPPTISMVFMVNNSPFTGKEGKLVTTRHIKERLDKEKETNVGLHVEEVPNSDSYKVSGRGELHLSVLIETMRREGFELQVSRPQVIMREQDGKTVEPMEQAIIDVPEEFSGTVIDMMSRRKGEMQNMVTNEGQTRLEFKIPTRGLLGMRGDFIIETRGEGILTHSFIAYEEHKGVIPGRSHGSMISMANGEAIAYAIWNLQERGQMFITPQTKIYEGMIVGESAKSEDLTVNPMKEKKLSNVRASGTDEAVNLVPVKPMTLEQALEYIDDDELVEVTPLSIRLRKKHLKEQDRRRSSK